MSNKKPFTPNFKTPEEALAPVEKVKKNALYVNREAYIQFRIEEKIRAFMTDTDDIAIV